MKELKQNCQCANGTIVEGIFGNLPSSLNSPQSQDNYSENELFDNHHPPPSIPIKSYTLTNKSSVEIVIISWGATVVSIKTPDKYGKIVDVALGLETLNDYMNSDFQIGCVLGRCADKIDSVKIKGKEYFLNNYDGFSGRIWNSHVDGSSVVMSYLSPDGEEGFPGAVLTTITFKLTSDNTLDMRMRATTTKPTVINLSYGLFFNLAGHDAGEEELKNHVVSLNCDRWIFEENSGDGPVVYKSRGVGGTLMDFRIPRSLHDEDYCVIFEDGFPRNFCVIRKNEGSTYVFRGYHRKTGRVLEVYSNQPGLDFHPCSTFPSENDTEMFPQENLDARKFDELASYTSFGQNTQENRDEGKEGEEGRGEQEEMHTGGEEYIAMYTPPFIFKKPRITFIPGKCGAKYTKFCGFGVHPQNYPNSAIKNFPCAIIRPGQVYEHNLAYKFGIHLENAL